MLDPADLRRIVVARRGGQDELLSHVAKVVDSHKEPETLAPYNGRRTLARDILKAQGQNTIEVADGLRQAIADREPTMRALYLFFFQAEDGIRDRSRHSC